MGALAHISMDLNLIFTSSLNKMLFHDWRVLATRPPAGGGHEHDFRALQHVRRSAFKQTMQCSSLEKKVYKSFMYSCELLRMFLQKQTQNHCLSNDCYALDIKRTAKFEFNCTETRKNAER